MPSYVAPQKDFQFLINEFLELETYGDVDGFAEAQEMKFGKPAGPLRAALAGRAATPSVFDMMLVLGRDETIARLNQAGEDGA